MVLSVDPKTTVARLDGTVAGREEGDQGGGNVTTQQRDEHMVGQTSESTVELVRSDWTPYIVEVEPTELAEDSARV